MAEIGKYDLIDLCLELSLLAKVNICKVSQAAVRVKVFTPQRHKPSPSILFVNGLHICAPFAYYLSLETQHDDSGGNHENS